jgi:hypothetical protein
LNTDDLVYIVMSSSHVFLTFCFPFGNWDRYIQHIAALHGDNSGSSNPNHKVVCLLNTFARPELRISIAELFQWAVAQSGST